MRNHAEYCDDSDASCHQASFIMMKPLDGSADGACSPSADGSVVAVVEPNPLPQRQLFLIWYQVFAYVNKHDDIGSLKA